MLNKFSRWSHPFHSASAKARYASSLFSAFPLPRQHQHKS